MRNHFKRKETVIDLEIKLATICEQIYVDSIKGRRLRPLHPFVLVRVLPKEHRTAGGLYLPGAVQNKTLYEGIVLETWQPYEEIRRVKREGKFEDVHVWHRPDVQVGDRVLFPHYEGMPLGEWLDDKYYRLVREGVDQNKFPYCSILAILDYEGDVEIQAQLKVLAQKFFSRTTSGENTGQAQWEPPTKASMFTS